MSRAILAFLALSALGFGVAFTVKPVEMAQVMDISLFTPASRTDFRAVYGGLQMGIGVFLLVCATRRHLVSIGLQAAAWTFLGLASARLVGLFADGFGQPLMVMLFAIEAMAAGLAAWAAWQVPPVPRPDAGPADTSRTQTPGTPRVAD